MELAEKSTAASGSSFGAVARMFYEPSATFAQLETRRSTWLPLLLVMLSGIIIAVWYYQFVDYAWLQEQFLNAIEDPAVRDRQREAGGMALGTLTAVTIVGMVIFYLVAYALTSLYLLIVSKVRNSPFTFGQGFSLAVWSSVPMLILLPLGAMQILLASNNQVMFQALNPLTLNQLVFHYEPAHAMAGVLESISLLTFWNIFLQVVGYQIWAKTSRATAVKVVVAPYIVIYGLWLAYALSKAA
ncbi:MAG TPA: YIP1 family protein [Telluria sp.]